MRNIGLKIIFSATMITGMGIFAGSQAAGYNPVTQQAQSKLTALGLNPGVLDEVLGSDTVTSIKAFQKQSGLPESGILDSATLAKLDIGTSVDKANAVADWIPVPTQDQLDKLMASPPNNPSSSFTDYRPNAPGANLRSSWCGDIGGHEQQCRYLWQPDERASQAYGSRL